MSKNFFAALDDSGDEAPSPVKSSVKKREPKNAKKAESSGSDTKAVSKGDKNRKPNNNDRNTKNGRGGRTAPRDGKRAYDRRSGTGRGKEIKKGGGGARNWGSDKAEAKKMEGKINEDEVKEDKPTEEKAEGDAADAPAEEEKPEDKTMTFAEYMASKGKKEENSVREVESEFKGLSASAKVEEDFLVMGGGKQKKTKKKKDGEKQTLEVGFRVATADSTEKDGRRRGDRDRGGKRDGRGKGRGGRGGRAAKNAGINVRDEAAFPSL